MEAADNAALTPHIEKHKTGTGDYIKDIIYGGLDGITSVFVTVVASVGGNQSVYAVLALTLAKLIAGALSMAVGDWMATDAEADMARREKRREVWEYDNNPEGEVDEMVELYVKKGVPEDVARRVMTILGQHKVAFVDIMMAEELGISPDAENESPWKHALATFVAFLVFGVVPLISYVVIVIIRAASGHAYSKLALYLAIGFTFITLCAMGIMKARVTGSSYWKSTLWTVALGSFTAFLGWFTSWILLKIFPTANVE